LLQSLAPYYAFVDHKQQIDKRDVGFRIGYAAIVELGGAIGVSILNHIAEVTGDDQNKKRRNNARKEG
jgi:DNA (cytosine-5)-methyltransferase 1